MNIHLKVAILESRQTQREIAARAALSESRLSSIVREWVEPTDDERFRLEVVLGVGPEIWPVVECRSRRR